MTEAQKLGIDLTCANTGGSCPVKEDIDRVFTSVETTIYERDAANDPYFMHPINDEAKKRAALSRVDQLAAGKLCTESVCGAKERIDASRVKSVNWLGRVASRFSRRAKS